MQKILNKNKLKLKNIRNFYVTIGPGNFTGCRTGFSYLRTICQVLNANLYVCNTLLFISKGINGTYKLNAKSNLVYNGVVNNLKIDIELKEGQFTNQIDYQNIKNNFLDYLFLFKKIDNLSTFKVNYIKEPRIS